MGCGKSSIGKTLTLYFPEYDFIDLDKVIEKEQHKSVAEIFKTLGEKEFRKIEEETLKKTLNNYLISGKNLILSLGGGTLTTVNCEKLIREKTICIYLRCTIDTLVKNISIDKSERPLLNGYTNLRNRIEELMSQRKDVYENTATYIVDSEEGAEESSLLSLISLIRSCTVDIPR